MKKFESNWNLTKAQIEGRIESLRLSLAEFNHEKEAVDAEINRLKDTRTGILRRYSNTDLYINELTAMLKSGRYDS